MNFDLYIECGSFTDHAHVCARDIAPEKLFELQLKCYYFR